MDFFDLYNDADAQGDAPPVVDSDDSSDDSSEDSATLRARQAQARLRDFGDSEDTSTSALPSAFSAFNEVAKPPSFLDPEATRALASAAHHGRSDADLPAAAENTNTWHGPKNRIPPGQTFDISKLAPPLKGAPRAGHDKRGVPHTAVIEGKAKRARADEAGPGGALPYSAAQIAMLGGQVPERKATPAMGVSEFLDRGQGGAQLPRKQQDRKDKEKVKRGLGQSAIGNWKSEAEMVLRQQYD